MDTYLSIVKGVNSGDELTIAINEISKLVEERAAVYSSEL